MKFDQVSKVADVHGLKSNPNSRVVYDLKYWKRIMEKTSPSIMYTDRQKLLNETYYADDGNRVKNMNAIRPSIQPSIAQCCLVQI